MKISRSKKNNASYTMIKKRSIKLLSLAILATVASSVNHASDLEIYQAPEGGNVVITMMLDNSISMGHGEVISSIDSIKDDYNIDATRRSCFLIFCSTVSTNEETNVRQDIYNDQGIKDGEISYKVYYREKDGQLYYDRISRLKMALIPMFANPKSNEGFGADTDINKYKIGIGSFETAGSVNDNGRGNIDVQAKFLNLAHRKNLINKIIGYSATKNTPTANSYAAAGADMLGSSTTTSSRSTSPIIPGQCNAQGIYFLTDGEPNQSNHNDTLNLMNNSLGKSPKAMGRSCNSSLTSSGARWSSSGWECTGEYAPLLNSSDNLQSAAIKTATVGFGSVYQEVYNTSKVSKDVTLDNGTTESREVYNCDGVTDTDARNLCKLGEKGYGFGEGGFYFVKEKKDISDSVKSFAKSLGDNVIQPISSGTMSVPLDSLSGLKSRGFAYLPILEPVPRSPRLWNGNLKKYKVKDATLVSESNNPVFSNTDGEFATNTHDLWNTLSGALRPDQGKPQVGGAYQKVFENATPSTIGDRNLFVDSGSALINLKVNAANVPKNFDALTPLSGTEPDKNNKKRALLSFMGYSVPSNTTVKDDNALPSTVNKTKELKNIGGVLHSIPQLITQKVNIDGAGKFDVSSRKDYVLYGSMDGALHMLDDSTGKETFTFIPKQILDLQPAAISGEGSAVDGSYPYGVDAPWLTYASYTVKETEGEGGTTTNTYEAAQSFALGGLRMGGSMYYALDVSNPTTPKMIYSVGSNYANRQKGLTTDVSGVANGVSAITSAITATADQKAYARMGQTWGKPTLGYVKSGGKRVMVSFLPGGYDACYENPKFKLNTLDPNNIQCNKSAAQGNAMYMVQVGEVETNATSKEETVKTSTNNGNLLWWASNSGSDITAASNSTNASLQYSKADDLKHSVVTQVRALDRNYDGLIDHIYFADLGGQVWRADINNNADTANFKVDRVVKVLDVSDQVAGDDAPPRIYERPLITFHNGTHAYSYIDRENKKKEGQYSGVQAMVTVGTGDRSNPVSATRSTPNAIYSVIDKDVSRNELFYYGTETAPTLNLRTPVAKVAGTSTRNDKLQRLTFTESDLGTSGIRAGMQNNTIQGWYMPLTHWLDQDAVTGGKYKLKMFNEPDAIAGVLISSSFNPDEGQAANTCSAGIIGETQRERTCLPYGVCLDNTKNEIFTPRSSYSAGLGIVDNIISQYNDTSTFTSLKNYCEGDDCEPEVICTGDDCNDINQCVGPDCDADAGVNVDQRINPLSWMEN